MTHHVDLQSRIARKIIGRPDEGNVLTLAACAISAISAWSVETTSRSMQELFRPASMAYAIRGRPPSCFQFLPGIPFEPPRALIRAKTRMARDRHPAGYLVAGKTTAPKLVHLRSAHPSF